MSLPKRMADKLAAEKHVTPEMAMKQVPSDQQLASLARKDGALSAAERKQLEQALGKYADPSNSVPIPSELGEALAKLAANKDYQAAMELMQKLAQKMNSGNMSKMDKEMLKQQLEALAKALKGTDLDKLAKMLKENAEKLAKMSPEELKKMLEKHEGDADAGESGRHLKWRGRRTGSVRIRNVDGDAWHWWNRRRQGR